MTDNIAVDLVRKRTHYPLYSRMPELPYRTTAGTDGVVVVFDAVRPGQGNAVQTRRFEVRVPGVTADVASVGPALNQAANDVAGQVAAWVG